MSNSQPGSAVIVHGGVGASRNDDDGCVRAAQRALAALGQGGAALDAAVAAVIALEDDGRFNAGSGSALGLDGATVEMDASIMDTRGRLGAVAAVRNVKNPVLLARAVADTPHCLIAGEGAERLARALGQPRGALAVSRTEAGACSNRDMPQARMTTQCKLNRTKPPRMATW
jgi:beta-aspartyl-peptidase (threonine type)